MTEGHGGDKGRRRWDGVGDVVRLMRDAIVEERSIGIEGCSYHSVIL
jgi:hypothetical protein